MSEINALNLKLFFNKDKILNSNLITKLLELGILTDDTGVREIAEGRLLKVNIPILTYKIDVNSDLARWSGTYEAKNFECTVLLRAEQQYATLTFSVAYSYEVFARKWNNTKLGFVRDKKFLECEVPVVFEKAVENCAKMLGLARQLIILTEPLALLGDINIINVSQPLLKDQDRLVWLGYFNAAESKHFDHNLLRQTAWQYDEINKGIFVCFDRTVDDQTNRQKYLQCIK